jgi:hypothetical protein
VQQQALGTLHQLHQHAGHAPLLLRLLLAVVLLQCKLQHNITQACAQQHSVSIHVQYCS